MFGGVAQTYCRYALNGEPYKKNGVYYIKVVHPLTKTLKEVRWYMDKKHDDLMPHKESPVIKVLRCFGFESEDDYIIAIRSRDITMKEESDFFAYNWKRGGKWKFGCFFGGIWYAPKDAAIPSIKNVDKVFRCTWKDFVAEAKKRTGDFSNAWENF